MKHGAKSVYPPVSDCGSTGPYIRSVKPQVIITRVQDQRDGYCCVTIAMDELIGVPNLSQCGRYQDFGVGKWYRISCMWITSSFVHDL